jgi:hypothetical protein
LLQQGDRDCHRLKSRSRCGGRGAWCAAAPKDLDNQHAAAAARARWALIGGGVGIGAVVQRERINRRHRGSDQLPGARNVGFAAGAGEQPVVADAVKSLWQNVEQEAPDELAGAEGLVALVEAVVCVPLLYRVSTRSVASSSLS